MPTLLALETSCDETAVAILRDHEILSSEIYSQIPLHRPFGGVVPELASRNHLTALRPTVEAALRSANLEIDAIDIFAATSGPGLASSLLVGNTAAKAMALAGGKPFVSVNHMEGHLLSPFIEGPNQGEVLPCLSLIVSGGHTMLVALHAPGNYQILGKTRDDAAGEAFDKVGKMLGLPYPGGPEIEKNARGGKVDAFDFPRSMMDGGLDFSFSGLKTSVLYSLEKIPESDRNALLPDLCASFQEAVTDVLVRKSILAAKKHSFGAIGLSGGVSCNLYLRNALQAACETEGLTFHVAPPALTTDNAAMIGFAAYHLVQRGITSPLEEDVNPNLALA